MLVYFMCQLARSQSADILFSIILNDSVRVFLDVIYIYINGL